MDDLTNSGAEPLWEDGEFVVARLRAPHGLPLRLIVSPVREQPSAASIAKLENALALRGELSPAWAAQPIDLSRLHGRPALVTGHPSGEFLHQAIGGPLDLTTFLRLAIAIASSLGELHSRGLVHKDVKPASIIVNVEAGKAWLAGFGLTTRLPRHRQAPVPPEIIAGTLPYMAPEQTGRMNRSVDSRSDLYSLGVTFYEMLTGHLPFAATSPMEWVHCHTARQPLSPCDRVQNVPVAVSAIIMKLLAKTAEDRYQSAAGAEEDLQRCLFEWESSGQVGEFALGEHDTTGRLLIPEKLYGRDREIGILLDAFDRVVAGGRPELVLVSGYSGIGKSAVVNELHKPLVPPRGLFASGKFDQYKRDIPYATLAQAFQGLLRPLLSKSEEELVKWRGALREALGPNGALVVDLVPELLHIVGEQPPVPELAPRDAQARFHLVLRRFIGVFARPEHPLALFLDDLQWLDAATLDLLEDLLSQADLQHLLLIGAYRDNEVHATHPLMRKLDAMRRAGFVLHDIVLAPLGQEDLGQLLANSLRSEPACVAPLAQLIHAKTSGNPFFAIQFIETLADETLLAFDHAAACWAWDLRRIKAKGYTDNVVHLVVDKLYRLPGETQRALQQFACLGNSAEFATLEMVHPGGEIHEHLWEAVRTGLILRADASYRFLHDRVQEAAYSLIPEEQRAKAHLRIGRLLAGNAANQGEAIFEIVNQLNRGLHLVTGAEEREWLAGLDLTAAKRAKASTAYGSALKYLVAGRSLLAEETWERNYDLIFQIECLTAECELLTADMSAAEKRLTLLSRRAKTSHDSAVVTRLQLTLYTALGRSEPAIEVSLDHLRRRGTHWSPHPTRNEVMEEYTRVWSLLGDRKIEDLADLPRLTDPDIVDLLDVFTEFVHPAMFYDENLSTLAVCRMVNLSLEHGNCDASAFGYVWLAMFAGPRFGDYKRAFRFGQLGYDLVETRGFTRYQARTYLSFATLTPWARHAAKGRELVRRAFEVAYRMGDLTFTTYSWHALITNFLAVGDPLEGVQAEAETGLAFATKMGFGLVIANCEAQLGLIRTLRGLTSVFGRFDDESYSEAGAEARFASNPALVLSECFYWTRKLQGRFFAGDYVAAVEAAQKAQEILWTAASQVETGDFRFYAALAHSAAWNSAPEFEKQWHFDRLLEHHRQLETWAEHCPANFENRAALVSAEISRIEGRPLDAEHAYEKAIHSARANDFIHNEAICHELAAHFYLARGFQTTADAHLGKARACYARWGAQGKVDQLETRFPQLKIDSPGAGVGASIDAPVAQIDADTVIKASQTLSSEINLTNLIEKLMELAVEYAGAQRTLLILLHGDAPHIEGEAKVGSAGVEIATHHLPVRPDSLLEAALQYVLRTRERLLLDDASSHPSYAEDAYVRRSGLRSVLCLPIRKQARVIGVLYLENNLTAHAFTAGRVAVLEVLASQAAISLENARLYAELEQENLERKQAEENLRLSEAILAEGQRLSLTGSFSWNLDDNSITLSAECRRIFGFSPDEPVVMQQIAERLHQDDLPMLAAKTAEARTLQNDHDYEVRLRMPDGTFKYLHSVSHPVLNRNGDLEYVGTIQDVTSRYLAEEQVRKSELHLRQMTETIPEMLWSATAEGAVDYCNGRLLEYSGFAAHELMGEGWMKLIHPDDVERTAKAWLSCVAAGTPYIDEMRKFHAADRSYRWCLSNATPLLDTHGRISKWYGTIVDIHDRKQAEEELRRSEARLREVQNELAHVTRVTTMGELAASIAHEINQPIAGVVINADTSLRWLSRVKEDSVNLREARATIERIISDGVRAGEIIARIRALFKKNELAKEPLDLNEAIREIVALARKEIDKRNVSLRLELPAGLPEVFGDRVQLQQVMLNLILNAIDAMSAVRVRDLVIGTRRHDEREVVVTVRDSGVGISLESEDAIFTAFHTTKPDGLGMGLPISRSIVESHSGRLWITGHEGPGASFHFTLPIAPAR